MNNVKLYGLKNYDLNQVTELKRAPLTEIKGIRFDLPTLYLGK